MENAKKNLVFHFGVGRQASFLKIGYVKKLDGKAYTYEFNIPNLVGRGSASNPKMEYQVFLCIFQKNSAMAT